MIDAESTALRKALRIAQIEEHTANDDAYQEFVASQAQTSETPESSWKNRLPRAGNGTGELDALWWSDLRPFPSHLLVRCRDVGIVGDGVVASHLGPFNVVLMYFQAEYEAHSLDIHVVGWQPQSSAATLCNTCARMHEFAQF